VSLLLYGVTLGLLYFFFKCFQNLELYSFLIKTFLSAPNLEKILIVAIKQGGTARAAISIVIKTIDSIINYGLFLITK
jgi:hypothetical protein